MRFSFFLASIPLGPSRMFGRKARNAQPPHRARALNGNVPFLRVVSQMHACFLLVCHSLRCHHTTRYDTWTGNQASKKRQGPSETWVKKKSCPWAETRPAYNRSLSNFKWDNQYTEPETLCPSLTLLLCWFRNAWCTYTIGVPPHHGQRRRRCEAARRQGVSEKLSRRVSLDGAYIFCVVVRCPVPCACCCAVACCSLLF